MNCGDMGLDIPDHECLAMIATIAIRWSNNNFFIIFLLVLICLTSLFENSINKA